LDAAQRWWSGQRLYTDIVEINPPLIFIENVLLTGGNLTKTTYLVGVCVVIGISASWVRRVGGNPFAAIAAMVLGGWTDFGQRDHLALIFLLPYLSTKEDNKAVGLWAFLGVGLKPYFAAIPLFFVFARCLLERSTKPMWQPQNWVLGICCVAYVAITALVWPQYFSEIIPTAQFVYAAYGTAPATSYLLIAALIGLLLLTVVLSQPKLIPLAAATLGAIVAFFIQGRYWSYQFIPSVGLTIYLVWLALPMERRAMQIPLAVILLAMIGVQLVAGPYALYYANPIPRGVRAVAFFSDNVAAAYPHVFDCQVVHTSRFPALWTIPGAWNALNDRASSSETRLQARHLLSREKLAVREDIRNGRPEIIFSDRAFGLSYFRYPFNYGSLVPNGYRQVGSIHGLDIWLRHDVPSEVLNRPSCS
jgi:hypothetical protein